MQHQLYELKQKQCLPLESKIILTQRRIKEWYEYWDGNVFVSLSGKDSSVLLDIARKMYPDIKAVFVNTGLEYPEVRECAISKGNVDILYPKKTFYEVIKEHGYPIISKEVSECVANARKHLVGGGYAQHYRKLLGIGEYATKGQETDGNINSKEFP